MHLWYLVQHNRSYMILKENSNFAVQNNKTMDSTRQKKISRLIQKELAVIFLRTGAEVAHGKMISITKVRISPDLSLAKIFVSIFPSGDQDAVLSSIHDHTSKIRYELGQKVRTQLRIIPELVFYVDDSLDYIDNIEKLLKT